MADVKISGLPASTVPLAGTEVLPIVQSSTTKKVSIANVTAGRAVSALSFAPTGSALPTNGLFLPATNAVGLSTDSEERLRVFATGGVSIGNTVDPGATNLSVTGALTLGTALSVGNGGTGLTTLTTGRIPYGNGTSALNTSANLYFSGTQLGVGTSTTFATISAELTGGNAINARYNSSNPRAGIYVSGGAGSTFFGSNLTYSSGNVFNYDKTGTAWFIGDAAGTGFFSIGVATGTAGTSAGTDTAANLRLNINTSGNVGIGTTAPTAKLSVANPSGSYGSTNPNFSLLYSTTEYFNAYMDGNWITHLSAPDVTGQTVGIAFDTVGLERMRVHASGGVSIGNTTDAGAGNLLVNKVVSVGGATPSVSGAGITFPATQSASTDPNTLDDYEEGTWNPVANGITVVTGTPVYTGKYTKIGRQVFLDLQMTGGDITITAGNFFSNLPFVSATNSWGVDGNFGYASTGGFCVVGGGTASLYLANTASYIGYFSLTITYTI